MQIRPSIIIKKVLKITIKLSNVPKTNRFHHSNGSDKYRFIIVLVQFFDNKDMSIKFNYGNYTLTTDFKDDFNISMTASDNFSGDYFLNEKVQLTKIKKDTIIATLSRKNEEHLKCEFSVIDVQPRKLVISFIVSFDFLPTFTEYISLDQIENKKGLNKVESAQLKSDIQQLDKLVSAISANKGMSIIERNLSINGKGDIHSLQLARGSYLLEISGFFTCTTGIQKNELAIIIQVDKEKHEHPLTAYTNSSYGYPVFIRKQLILSMNSTVKILVEHKQGATFTLSNSLVTASPILKLR